MMRPPQTARNRGIRLLALALILAPLLGHAATYYVRNGGDDTQSGLDDANAWASLAKVAAAASTLKPGDAMLFQRGSVWSNDSLTIASVKGSATQRITFGSYGTAAARPKILRNLPRDGYCAKFTDCSYITIQGLDLGAAGIGLWINTAKAAQAGVTVDDCYIHDIYGFNYYYPSTVLPGQYPAAINVSGVDGLTITNCTSYNAGSFLASTASGPALGRDPDHLIAGSDPPVGTPILNKNVLISGCLADRNLYYGFVLVNMIDAVLRDSTATRAGSMPMVNGSIGIMLGNNNRTTLSNLVVEKTDKFYTMRYLDSTTGTLAGPSTAPDGGGIDFEINNQQTDIVGCRIAHNSQEGVMLYNNGGSTHSLCDITGNEFEYNNLRPSQSRPEIWFSQSDSNNGAYIQDNRYWLLSGKTFLSTARDPSVVVSNNLSAPIARSAPAVPAGPTGFAKVYDFSTGVDGWTFTNFKYSGQNGPYWGGFVGGIFQNSDPYLVSPTNIGTAITDNRLVVVKFRNLSPSSNAQIFFTTTTSTSFNAAKSVTFPVVPYDTQSRVYVVDMSANSAWTGTLRQLRFDPTGGEWDMTEIDYIGVTGIGTWFGSNFTAAELANPAISGPDADPDQDGFSNLLEYALGLNPKLPERSNKLPALAGADASAWTYTYTRPILRSAASYSVEVSTDLVTWNAAGVAHTLVANTDATETWQATYPRGADSKVFFRLKISSAP